MDEEFTPDEEQDIEPMLDEELGEFLDDGDTLIVTEDEPSEIDDDDVMIDDDEEDEGDDNTIPAIPDVPQIDSPTFDEEDKEEIQEEYDDEEEEVDDSSYLDILSSVVGSDVANKIDDFLAMKGQGETLEDIIELTELDEGYHFDVLSNSHGTSKYLRIVDSNGQDITKELADNLGFDTEFDGLFEEITMDRFYEGSLMTFEENADSPYSAKRLGQAISSEVESLVQTISEKDRRDNRLKQLEWVRSLVSQLGGVFGFDDYRQLEAFVAAWLMKNSTCRLSGIPGTGKTTVINSAATLLGNSYGFHQNAVYLPDDYVRQNISRLSADSLFGNNEVVTNAHRVMVAPRGQVYSVIYNDQRNENLYTAWDSWRFTDWVKPKNGRRSLSGAYQYSFAFLRGNERPLISEGEEILPAVGNNGKNVNYKKTLLGPDLFHKLLFNAWVVEVPEDFDLARWNSSDTKFGDTEEGKAYLAKKKELAQTKFIVKPIMVHDGSNWVDFTSQTPTFGPYSMSLRFGDVSIEDYKRLFPISVNDFVTWTDENGLYTDTGRSEGYYLRHLLCHFCRDNRVKSSVKDISMEMLREIGIAKIDFDKRPDEVLYGLEIRSVESVTPKGEVVNTYEFEPVPREIVTQPIKFFNEANRSQAGVEDAVLGLIAEQVVEYRGKSFKSPDFVAWMDTNPHQKGNDLAFTDRIDMELLFKSVSMGGRYDQLSSKYGGRGGAEPNIQLTNTLINSDLDQLSSGNYFIPMRLSDLSRVWQVVGKETRFTSSGSTTDGFRDISVISVLFSQIFAKRPDRIGLQGMDQDGRYSFSDPNKLNLYESPLLDFSTTTNTTSSAETGTGSPVLEQAMQTRIFGQMEGDQARHIPVVFNRVLGFRFTNSLVKLSQAFAFLRGKEYVSRQEILDAVPYVIAHRMGRAKAGAKDAEGNTKGLSGDVGYVNEQEFVREFIVKGYLEGSSSGSLRPNFNLMDNADMFYQYCRNTLDSVQNVWEYESNVLIPLYLAIQRSGGDTSNPAISPIHWHIATMVVEEERKGRSRNMVRKYSSSMAGPEGSNNVITTMPQNYPEMYNNYETMILRPLATSQSQKEPIMWDYYRLRGLISREPNLFTNDKQRLLSMLEGEMRSISGSDRLEIDPSMLVNTTNIVKPFPQAISLRRATYYAPDDQLGGPQSGPWPQATRIGWRTYDDAQGAYGCMIGLGNLNVQSVNFQQPTQIDQAAARASSSQAMRLSASYFQNRPASATGKHNMSNALENFRGKFSDAVGRGYVLPATLGLGGNNASVDLNDVVPITFDQWINNAKAHLTNRINNPIGAATGGTTGDRDYFGVFELEHSPLTSPQIKSRQIKGVSEDDKLRLWLRVSQVALKTLQNTQPTGAASANAGDQAPLVEFLFTVGITSACGVTVINEENNLAVGEDFTAIPWEWKDQFDINKWTQSRSQSGCGFPEKWDYANGKAKGSKTIANCVMVDLGNMTMQDRVYYNREFSLLFYNE